MVKIFDAYFFDLQQRIELQCIDHIPTCGPCHTKHLLRREHPQMFDSVKDNNDTANNILTLMQSHSTHRRRHLKVLHASVYMKGMF